MNKVEKYSQGIGDACLLKDSLAMTGVAGSNFENDELNSEVGEGVPIYLVYPTDSYYFGAQARQATEAEKKTAGNLIVEVKVQTGASTKTRHYIITNLTAPKVLTITAAERVLPNGSKYVVLGSQEKLKVLAKAHKTQYKPQTLPSLMSDMDGLKTVEKGGTGYIIFHAVFGFASPLFGNKAPKVLTPEAIQRKQAEIEVKKAPATTEVMENFRGYLRDYNIADLAGAINAKGGVPEAIIRNLTDGEIWELKRQLTAAGEGSGGHASRASQASSNIDGIQLAIKQFDENFEVENLHQELAPSKAIGLWVVQSVILLSVGLILLGVVTVSGTGIAFGALAFTLTSPASWIGLLLLVGIVAPGLPGYLLKSGGGILRFIGALGALLYQAVGNFAYDIHEIDDEGKAGVYKGGKKGLGKSIARGFVRFFVLPLIVVPIAFALNLPVALVSKQSPFSKIEIHNTRALVVGAPASSKGKEINVYHGLARIYTWSAKTLVIAVSLAIFALCIASLFVAIPQLIPILTVAADVLGYALLPFTFGLVTGPTVVSFIVPVLLAGPTSIILVAIFALAVAARVAYVWWTSLRRGINDARSNLEAAFTTDQDTHDESILTEPADLTDDNCQVGTDQNLELEQPNRDNYDAPRLNEVHTAVLDVVVEKKIMHVHPQEQIVDENPLIPLPPKLKFKHIERTPDEIKEARNKHSSEAEKDFFSDGENESFNEDRDYLDYDGRRKRNVTRTDPSILAYTKKENAPPILEPVQGNIVVNEVNENEDDAENLDPVNDHEKPHLEVVDENLAIEHVNQKKVEEKKEPVEEEQEPMGEEVEIVKEENLQLFPEPREVEPTEFSYDINELMAQLSESNEQLQQCVAEEAKLQLELQNGLAEKNELKLELQQWSGEKAQLELELQQLLAKEEQLKLEQLQIVEGGKPIAAEKPNSHQALKNHITELLASDKFIKKKETFFKRGAIFEGASAQQISLVGALETQLKKTVGGTRILYRRDNINKASIYDCIQDKNNIVVLFRMKNGNICAGFSELPVNTTNRKGDVVFMALWNNQSWKEDGDTPTTILYQDNSLILGGPKSLIQLRIKNHGWQIMIKADNKNLMKEFSDGVSGQFEIDALEVHQVVFKDVHEKENEKENEKVVGEDDMFDSDHEIIQALKSDLNTVEKISQEKRDRAKQILQQTTMEKTRVEDLCKRDLPSNYDKDQGPLIYQRDTFFMQGNIFRPEQDDSPQRYLVQTLESKLNKTVRKTLRIYHVDPKNPISFHRYIDDKENIVVLVRLTNGKICAAFSALPFAEGCTNVKGTDAFLMELCSEKVWEVDKDTNAIKYDTYYLLFGNAELRYQMGKNTIFSNFGISESHYQTNGAKIAEFVGEGEGTGLNANDREFDVLEVYQVLFE